MRSSFDTASSQRVGDVVVTLALLLDLHVERPGPQLHHDVGDRHDVLVVVLGVVDLGDDDAFAVGRLLLDGDRCPQCSLFAPGLERVEAVQFGPRSMSTENRCRSATR
jgi:hypothetical protein